MEDDKIEFVEFDGQQVSLADLAGIDMSDLGEARFSNIPKGVFKFVFLDGQKAPAFHKLGDSKFGAVFFCKVLDVLGLVDKNDAPDGDATKLIGKEYRETQFISSQESFKYLNAFITDLGGAKTGSYADKFASLVGIEFTCPISYRKDKNDSSKEYPQMVVAKARVLSRPVAAA